MKTRQELILEFMMAMAASDYFNKQMDSGDPDMVADSLYLRAAKFADTYLSFQ